MFLGYQDDLVALAAKTRAEIINAPCMEFTSIVQTNEHVELIDGVYCIGADAINKAQRKSNTANK